ncbi:MAG TPA: dTDP-4-dehydrorhamnose reductase [Thermoanaerobaculia bacterium]|nr:dTDP-4-dehydrorhamnose reductase [Thermoanaerobaculia bacterium]
MRMVVFGGTGLLGKALVAEARTRGWAALALSHSQAEITNRERLLYWTDSFRPELVVNCAAYTKVDDCETHRDRAFAANGQAVENLAAAARQVGARLFHVSTDYVFDGTATEPYKEDAPTAPQSVYGASKLEGERRALEYEKSLVVRTSWLFGPGGPSFVTTMLRLIDEGKLPLRVVHDQVGCPTYAPFLAGALLDLAATDLTGIVHYRNREPVSWYDFAQEIAHLWSGAAQVVPVPTAEFPRPAQRPAYSVLDVTRFEAAVGRRVEPWGWGLVEYLARLRQEKARKGRTSR